MKHMIFVILVMAFHSGVSHSQTGTVQHPDPRSGLGKPVGACFERNLNGAIVSKAKTQKACASHSVPSVWVEGNRIVSFGRSAPPSVATGAKSAAPQKAPL